RECLESISVDSPYHRLSQIELQALNLGTGEVFRDGTPIEFMCPITDDTMEEPVSYEINGHFFFFEREAIERWIQNKFSCPMTRAFLSLDMLKSANDLALTIQL